MQEDLSASLRAVKTVRASSTASMPTNVVAEPLGSISLSIEAFLQRRIPQGVVKAPSPRNRCLDFSISLALVLHPQAMPEIVNESLMGGALIDCPTTENVISTASTLTSVGLRPYGVNRGL